MIRVAMICLLSIISLCATAQTPRPLQDLTTLASPATGDLAYMVDVSASNASRKITLGALQSWWSIATSQITGTLPIANGGTGATTAGGARTALGLDIGTNVQAFDAQLQQIADLADPNADRLLFWDDSAGALTWLTAGSGLSISGTTITASGGGGGSGTVTSVDVSGASTGLTFSGGPITTGGTITLGGTLGLANGGTGSILGDPDSDNVMMWNDTISAIALQELSPTLQLKFGAFGVSDALEEWDAKTAPTGDVVGTNDTQTITYKTLSTGTAIDLGSDATGDIYYRNSGGDLARLGIGSSNQVLTVDSGLPAWKSSAVTIKKPTNTTKNADTTYTADPHLQFSMAANTTYSIRAVVNFYASVVPDFKIQITGPASPTVYYAKHRRTAATLTTDTVGVDTAYSTSIAITSTGSGYGIIEYTILVQNGANAGTFAVEWAQNTSDASDTIVLAGSYIEYR